MSHQPSDGASVAPRSYISGQSQEFLLCCYQSNQRPRNQGRQRTGSGCWASVASYPWTMMMMMMKKMKTKKMMTTKMMR